MKRLFLISLLLCIVLSARAQQTAFGELFGRYVGREGFTSIELGEKMMTMMSRRAAGDDKALARLLGDIRSISIVAALPGSHNVRELESDVLRLVAQGKYALVLSRSEGEQVLRFYFIDGGPRGRSELLMLTSGPKECVVVDVYGLFDVKDISRLSAIRPM